MKTALLFLSAAFCLSAQTAGSPSLARDSRCFEMRTYHAMPGKFEELHARFRNHAVKLFEKHGMTMVGFWVPTDAAQGAANTLVYVLAYKDREAREAAWKAFQADPAWKEARTKSEANGRLVEKIDSVFLSATDYSPMK